MPISPAPAVRWRTLLGIALLSAALLAFQILLTRVCALRLHFHFSFLVISNCLLGIGASGTLLALTERRWRSAPDRWIWTFTVLFLGSLLLCWEFLRTFHVPLDLRFENTEDIVRFGVFNLVASVPFFFGGAAVGLILTVHAERVHRVYAADLVGAGLGCLLCPLLLWPVGAGGCLMAVVALTLAALPCVAPPGRARQNVAAAGILAAAAVAAMPFYDDWFPVPGKRVLDLTHEHQIQFAKTVEYTRWSANSRIDVLPVPEPMRFMQCRGEAILSLPLPAQKFISQDGDAGTFLSDFSSDPDNREVLVRSMYSTAFAIKEGTKPKVFVIGVGGGHDVWAALLRDPEVVRGIELNAAVLEVHSVVAPDFSRGLLEDPRVELVVDEGRSALMREAERYDVIQMTGIDTWTALASGAYVLAENYLYTVEALRLMYDRLAPGGILQVTRMAADMETLRLLVNMMVARGGIGTERFADQVAVVGTEDGLRAVLLRKGAFPEAEVSRLEAFAESNGILRYHLPGRRMKSVIQQFLFSEDKQAFIDSFPRDISPTTDNRPYFFNFTRWSDPIAAVEFVDEPTSISQGNPAFLLGQLAWSALLAAVFIVLPLWIFRREPGRGTPMGRFLVYFAGLGVGFIFLEIALIQKLTLLLGQPLYSVVVTLFAILICTGLGSMLSEKWLQGGVGRGRAIPAGIAGLVLLFVLIDGPVVDALIGLPLFWRAAGAVALIAPVAVLLGMPFAHGISLLRRVNPGFVPWAWAVNGSTTVVGSVLTVVVSMNFGFDAVLLAAVAVYALAFAAIDRHARS